MEKDKTAYPDLAKLGHVALKTPNLDQSLWFFRDIIGLEEMDRVDDTVYLRGQLDWEHHTLCLSAADESGVDHIGWRTQNPNDVSSFANKLEDENVDIEWVDENTEKGQGEAIRFQTPHGHPFEIYYDVEKPDAPEEKRSRLANRQYSTAASGGITPRRIDHVNIQDPNPTFFADWLETEFGFEQNELYKRNDGSIWGIWMSITSLTHDLAFHESPNDDPAFHHIAYHLNSLEELWNAGDILREKGITLDGGPGRHAITQADFIYVKDPGSNIRLELFAGPGYLNFEPDWEPIEWKEDAIGSEANHQWLGEGPSGDGITY